MRVAMVAAGFTGGQAEELRRAMAAKRSVERMQQDRAAAPRGHGGARHHRRGRRRDRPGHHLVRALRLPGVARRLFALIAYASAYLKAHHPAAFLCALLNAWPMGFYHPATLVQDAQRHGVRVLPIDVNCLAVACRLERGGPWPVDRGSWPEFHLPPKTAGGAGCGETRSNQGTGTRARMRPRVVVFAAPAGHGPRATGHESPFLCESRATGHEPRSFRSSRAALRQGPARGVRTAHRRGGGARAVRIGAGRGAALPAARRRARGTGARRGVRLARCRRGARRSGRSRRSTAAARRWRRRCSPTRRPARCRR